MTPEQLLITLLDSFYIREDGGLEWRYNERVSLGDIGEQEVEKQLIAIKLKAENPNGN